MFWRNLQTPSSELLSYDQGNALVIGRIKLANFVGWHKNCVQSDLGKGYSCNLHLRSVNGLVIRVRSGCVSGRVQLKWDGTR